MHVTRFEENDLDTAIWKSGLTIDTLSSCLNRLSNTIQWATIQHYPMGILEIGKQPLVVIVYCALHNVHFPAASGL